MTEHAPRFIREIKETLDNSGFRHRFEYDTGYPISIYKTDTELAMAFILHREGVEFEYGKTYPERGTHKCEVDFVLCEERIFKPLPVHMNVVHWAHRKPVRWVEIKRSVHNLYDIRLKKEEVDELTSKKLRYRYRDVSQPLFQREFLRYHGIETFPLGEDGLEHFYSNGLLADY